MIRKGGVEDVFLDGSLHKYLKTVVLERAIQKYQVEVPEKYDNLTLNAIDIAIKEMTFETVNKPFLYSDLINLNFLG